MTNGRYRVFVLPSDRIFGNTKILIDMETGQWNGFVKIKDIYQHYGLKALHESPLNIKECYMRRMPFEYKIKYLVDNLLNEEDKKRLGL